MYSIQHYRSIVKLNRKDEESIHLIKSAIVLILFEYTPVYKIETIFVDNEIYMLISAYLYKEKDAKEVYDKIIELEKRYDYKEFVVEKLEAKYYD